MPKNTEANGLPIASNYTEQGSVPTTLPLTSPQECNTIMTNDTEQDTLYQVLKHGYCGGYHCKGKGIAEEDHTCPFAEEIHGDTRLCNCCQTCEYQCAMDI